MKKILLPIDGSESPKTYEMARSLAKQYNGTLVILHVDEPITPIYWANETLAVENPTLISTNNGETIVAEAKKHFEDDNIDIKTICKFGDPSSVIIEVSEDEECDVIVMCTHGMSAIKRFLLGSVTNKVVHHATKPVLVVR